MSIFHNLPFKMTSLPKKKAVCKIYAIVIIFYWQYVIVGTQREIVKSLFSFLFPASPPPPQLKGRIYLKRGGGASPPFIILNNK